jgi:hypothetical protein
MDKKDRASSESMTPRMFHWNRARGVENWRVCLWMERRQYLADLSQSNIACQQSDDIKIGH